MISANVQQEIPPPPKAWPLLPAAALVLLTRLVYLARFGWDACPMNVNFLAEAKAFSLGRVVESNGLPFTPFALWLLRALGLGPGGALAAVYLLGQALFTVAALALFRLFSGAAEKRQRMIFVGVLSFVPLLSTDTAYKDLAVLLGAGLFLTALACAFQFATQEQGGAHLWIAAAICAALGGASRLESLAGTVSAAGMLLIFGRPRGRPIEGIVRPRASAFALALGSALGLLLTLFLAFAMHGHAQIGSAAYSFYTFSDGLPFLMRLHPGGTGEYGRYRAAMTIFGGFAQNHGSLPAALLAHPCAAVLRFVLKIPDLFVGIVNPRGVTPVLAALALVGVWRARDRGGKSRPRGLLLLAFLGPLVLLFVPPASPEYFLPLLFPILFAATLGIEALAASVSDRAVLRTTGVAWVIGVVAVAFFGRVEKSSSPAINQAAEFLTSRCRDGCLVNYLPQVLSSEAWTDLDAGAPLPTKVKRSESFVLRQYPPGYEAGCRFDGRRARARAAGYRGAILYVEARLADGRLFDEAFDPEHWLEGAVNLSAALLERRFTSGGDTVSVYRLNSD
jgi:MFS family permease